MAAPVPRPPQPITPTLIVSEPAANTLKLAGNAVNSEAAAAVLTKSRRVTEVRGGVLIVRISR
jgi:hypothetical protein